ncbi:MAG: helix-turn-helix domain-containing protein [Patescibacteria group bacterium]
MNKIIEYLTELGLSQKEARVYVALLEIDRGTAYAIAKQSGLKRSTVYLLLEELREKNLVLKIPHAKNQVFIAKDPEEFFSNFEDKLYKAKRTIPSLLQKYTKSDMASHLFDGKLEMKKALEYRREELKGGDLVSFCGVPMEGKKVPGMYFDHAQALKDQSTKVRVIAPKDESIRKFNDENAYGQSILLMPKDKFLPKVSMEISPDYAKIFLYTVSQALVIENKEFSNFMKQIFELLWERKNKNSLS